MVAVRTAALQYDLPFQHLRAIPHMEAVSSLETCRESVESGKSQVKLEP